MKGWLFTVTIVFLLGLPGTTWSIQNPGVGSPVGPGTVPPSSIRSGLVSSPNPIDTSGNLAITGNVRGGKYFRGTVPYRWTTDFGESVDSSSLDSFLRDSASPEDFGRYAGGYRSYYAPAGTVMGSYKAFYSPTGTVAATQPGRAGILMLSTAKIRSDAVSPDGFAVGAEPKEQDLSGGDASASGLRLLGPQLQVGVLGEPRPMSRTPREIERLISDELDGELSRRGLTNLRVDRVKPEQYQDEMEQLQRELKRISDEATGLEQALTAEDKPLRSFREAEGLPTKTEPSEGIEGLFDPAILDGEAGTKELTPTQPGTSGLDTYESADGAPGTIKGTWQSVEEMKQHIHSLTAAQAQKDASEVQQDDFEKLPGVRLPTFGKTKDIDGRTKGPTERGYGVGGFRTTSEGLRENFLTDEGRGWISAEQETSSKKTSVLDGSVYGGSARGVLGSSGGTYSARSPRSTSSGAGESQSGVDVSGGSDLASRARAIMGEYKSVAAFWEGKFHRYMAAGETYLKQGRYYRAVDAFALASVYKPDAPAAYVGRSLALFAAGEYMSSALFLSRALEMHPEYARSKAYFSAMLCDKDKLAERIADAEECLELCRKPGSGLSGETELAFLLGYVYYQMDRLGEAKRAIEAAEKIIENRRSKTEITDSWPVAVRVVKKAVADAIRRTN